MSPTLNYTKYLGKKMNKTSKKSARVWLVLAAALGACWLLLWLSVGRDKHELLQKAHAGSSGELSLPNTLHDLEDFKTEVPPISFDVITRDLRSYPKEFKSKDFFEKNRKKWTVQVMDVNENKIIVDYLDKRNDRDQFAYFRYTNSEGHQRYLLTYGVMATFQEAMGASRLVDFQLPNSARVLPESMERYVQMVDNYVLPDEAVDLAPKKQVKLKEAKQEVAPQPLPEEEVIELAPVEPSPPDEASEPAKKSDKETKPTQSGDKSDKKTDKADRTDKAEKTEKADKKPKTKPAELPQAPTAKPVDVGSLPIAPAFDELGQ